MDDINDINDIDNNEIIIEKFWQDFLISAKLDPNTNYYDSFYFGFGEKTANNLLQLVLQEKKKATSSSMSAYGIESHQPPKIGDYSIVTDYKGNPHCVIKTTNITILPFNQITDEMARREGEGDLTAWVDSHKEFFSQDADELGYIFEEDALVLFEDFELVYTPS